MGGGYLRPMAYFRFTLAFGTVLAAVVGLGCASDHDGRDRYDDRYYRNDPYYGHPNPYPVPYGHPDYDSRVERHQQREKRALEQEQQSEDRSLKHEQKDERRDLKQADEWSKDDKQRQREERKELERQQQDERKDLKRHQKQERQDY